MLIGRDNGMKRHLRCRAELFAAEFRSPFVALRLLKDFRQRVPLMGFVVSHEPDVIASLVHIAFEACREVTLYLEPVIS
jgi:hypothetical protein